PVPAAGRRARTAATVLVLPAECGGVLAASPDVVATALHCIDRGAALRVRTSGGAVLRARLEATDPAADQAILLLERPAAAQPLTLLRRPPILRRGPPRGLAGRPLASTAAAAASRCPGCPTRSSPASAANPATRAHPWSMAPHALSGSCTAAHAARSRRRRRASRR